MRIMFMGTPEIASSVLEAVAQTGEEIAAVVTQPDKPKGRGYNMTPPPVKVTAERLGIAVSQPDKIRTEEFARYLDEIDPELIVVVAYGKILPKFVLDKPRYGCVNAHASLLPKYRGAAPIQRAIMDGERETGVTAMYMDEGLDTGDMILTRRVEIADGDDFFDVHDKLAKAASEAIVETIKRIKDGTVTRTPQPDGATYAHKIEDADMVIDFSCDAKRVYDKIRALTPFAYTKTPDGKRLRIIAGEYDAVDDVGGECGQILSTSGGKIAVRCGSGTLYITKCQPEGKRAMGAADLVNGRRIKTGDILG